MNWIIRINKVIRHFKFSLEETLKFAKQIKIPTEKTEEKDWYSFHLENSVYRLLVLWDLYSQCLNEFYELGYNRTDNFNIWKVIRKLNTRGVVEKSLAKRIKKYCNTELHQFVRTYLRNTFTHNGDPHETLIFHRFDENDFLSAENSTFLPEHHFKELLFVINDYKILTKLLSKLNLKIEELMWQECVLINYHFITKCGKEITDGRAIHTSIIKELKDMDFVTLDKDQKCYNCIKLTDEPTRKYCKPIMFVFNRVHEPQNKYCISMES